MQPVNIPDLIDASPEQTNPILGSFKINLAANRSNDRNKITEIKFKSSDTIMYTVAKTTL